MFDLVELLTLDFLCSNACGVVKQRDQCCAVSSYAFIAGLITPKVTFFSLICLEFE